MVAPEAVVRAFVQAVAAADEAAAAALWTEAGWRGREGGRHLFRQGTRTGVVLEPTGEVQRSGDRAVVSAARRWTARDERVGAAWLLLSRSRAGWVLEGSEETAIPARLYLEGAIEACTTPLDLPQSEAGWAWGAGEIARIEAELVRSAQDLRVAGGGSVAGEIPWQPALEEGGGSEASAPEVQRPWDVLAAAIEAPRVLVVSAEAGEGKSTTSAQLALAWARAGQRVLVVDADLRRPRLWRRLGELVPRPGLAEVAHEGADLSQVVQPTGFLGLDVLVAGRPSPDLERVLAEPAVRRALTEAAQRYDRLILDAPPLLAFDDALLLLRQVPAPTVAIGVAEAGKTTRSRVAEVNRRLSEAGTAPSWVLNRAGAADVTVRVAHSLALAARRRVAVAIQLERSTEPHGRLRWVILSESPDGDYLVPIAQTEALSWTALVSAPERAVQ